MAWSQDPMTVTLPHAGVNLALLSTMIVTLALPFLLILLRNHKKRATTTVPANAAYDYIICGGGLAGSVLAARLSEDPSKSVLIIETGTTSPNSLFVRISGAILKLFRNPAFDWCWQTAAEAGCAGRRIFLCRGKLLGGSTCLNAQLAFRGSPRDYDSWGEGWRAEDIEPEFSRIELRSGEPMASCGMHVQLPNYQHELSRRFLRTCDADGSHPDLQPRASFNDWIATDGSAVGSEAGGSGAAASEGGFGRFELSQRGGARWTGANSYLAVAAARPNVTVLTGQTVARINLETAAVGRGGDDGNGGGLVATGVTLKDVTDGARRARREKAKAEVRAVLAASEPRWGLLASRLAFLDDAGCAATCAAARKLISNRRAILADATHPEPTTQIDLARPPGESPALPSATPLAAQHLAAQHRAERHAGRADLARTRLTRGGRSARDASCRWPPIARSEPASCPLPPPSPLRANLSFGHDRLPQWSAPPPSTMPCAWSSRSSSHARFVRRAP